MPTNRSFVLLASLLVLHVKSVALRCPDNYLFQEGDAVGKKWAIEVSGRFFNFVNSAEECGTLCHKTESCKAIEWRPSKKICVIINRNNNE